MKLSSFIDKELIFWDSDVVNKDELYEMIATKISDLYGIDKTKIFESFKTRDKLGHTVFPGGIAIPHGRLEKFDDLIISVVKNKNEILFGNEKASYFFVILTGSVGSNTYLKALSLFAKLAAKYINELHQFKSGDDFLDFLEENNFRLSEPVKVADVMTKNPIVAYLDDTVEKIADLMKKHNIIFLPVSDKNGTYLGSIDILDLLKLGYPEYTLMLTNLAFLSSLRAYEEYEKKEKITLIKELYRPAEDKIIKSTANIIELGYLLVKNRWHHITVVDDNKKIIGVVSTRTVLHNIVRA